MQECEPAFTFLSFVNIVSHEAEDMTHNTSPFFILSPRT